MIPDVEAAVVQYLLANEPVTDIVGANRVSTDLPPAAQLPRLRVTLTGGSVVVQRWLYAQRITVEGWAEDKATAYLLTATALDELQSGLASAQVDEGIVTACEQDSGLLWAPDPDTQTARYLGSVLVYIHPNPNP